MADNVSNLILEQLQLLRRGQEEIRGDLGEVKSRMTGFEMTLSHVMTQMGHLQMQVASQTHRIDRFDERFTRLESRLDRLQERLDRIEGHLGLVQV